MNAASICAAALADESHAHQITASERYAGALVEDLPTLDEGSSITFTDTRNGVTVDGTPMAQWVADLASSPKMNYVGTTASVTKTSQGDTVTLSPQATALLERQQIALAVITKGKATNSASNAGKQGTDAKQTSATPSTSATTTSASNPLFPSAAGFQAQYAAELADGPAGRFYNSTNPQSLAPMMSQDEYASFQEAFDSRTLTIQSAADTPGVQFIGSDSTTFAETGAGGSEYSRGGQVLDMTQFLQTTKYSLVSWDPFFGPTIVSWGGPPDSGVTP
jgi:hypothetical protein